MLEEADFFLEGVELMAVVIAQVGQSGLFLLFDQVLEGVYRIR